MLKQVVHIVAKVPLGLAKNSDYVLSVSLCILPTQQRYVKICVRFSWLWCLVWWYKCTIISEKADSSTFMLEFVGNRSFRNVYLLTTRRHIPEISHWEPYFGVSCDAIISVCNRLGFIIVKRSVFSEVWTEIFTQGVLLTLITDFQWLLLFDYVGQHNIFPCNVW